MLPTTILSLPDYRLTAPDPTAPSRRSVTSPSRARRAHAQAPPTHCRATHTPHHQWRLPYHTGPSTALTFPRTRYLFGHLHTLAVAPDAIGGTAVGPHILRGYSATPFLPYPALSPCCPGHGWLVLDSVADNLYRRSPHHTSPYLPPVLPRCTTLCWWRGRHGPRPHLHWFHISWLRWDMAPCYFTTPPF